MALALAYVPFFVYLCPRKGFFSPRKETKKGGHNPGKDIFNKAQSVVP